jgi:hypothetical protein
MCFCILVTSFTSGLIDPAFNPARAYITELIFLIFLVAIVTLVGVVLIVVSSVCEEILEKCEHAFMVIELPLDTFGCPRLVAIKPSGGSCMKAWRSSEGGDATKCKLGHSLLTYG